MDDEQRNEALSVSRSGNSDSQETTAQEPGAESVRPKPGEANPALAETKSYEEGEITTAEFLRARGSGEAQLPGAYTDRDHGLAGRPPLHGSPGPFAGSSPDLTGYPQPSGRLPLGPRTSSAGAVRSEGDLYDEEEHHVMHEEPEMHQFAPHMLHLPSDEKENKE